MFYVLKGWAKFYFEGTGEVEVAQGSCVNMPGGIEHDLRDHSEDFEFLEIISPAQYDTEWMKPVE
jgi:mannose-6-phosphate isomerase-like protein (cupin superfamily)